jgi:DNA-binding NarL/FixJ family response regulator
VGRRVSLHARLSGRRSRSLLSHHNVLIITPSDLIATAFQTILTAQNISTVFVSDVSDGPLNYFLPQVIFLDDAIIAENTRLEGIQKQYPKSKIAILSLTCQPTHVWKIIKAGAIGYLYLRDHLVSRIPLILEDVLNGSLYLSPSAQVALTSIRYYRSQDLTSYQADVLRLTTKHWIANRIVSELDGVRLPFIRYRKYYVKCLLSKPMVSLYRRSFPYNCLKLIPITKKSEPQTSAIR